MLFVTPMTFLGGAFYSVSALAEPWRTVTLFNPVVYLVSGFRWTFFGVADVPVWSSVAVMAAIIALCLAAITWIFKSGYRLKK
jgi:ABC-2 type transport system permease protein